MNLAPVALKPSQYTDGERAIIAGYLLAQREGTLQALSSSELGANMDVGIGQEFQLLYYQHCESYSRFLLYWIGYEVAKNQMYSG